MKTMSQTECHLEKYKILQGVLPTELVNNTIYKIMCAVLVLI